MYVSVEIVERWAWFMLAYLRGANSYLTAAYSSYFLDVCVCRDSGALSLFFACLPQGANSYITAAYSSRLKGFPQDC